MNQNFKMQEVTSLDLPELQPYQTLRRPHEHIRDGIFVAEGEKVVRRLLASDLIIISMLMTPQWHKSIFPNEYQTSDNGLPLDDHSKNPILHHSISGIHSTTQPTVFIAEKNLLETIVGNNLHQGIMAVAKVPSPMKLEEMIAKFSEPYLVVALDGLVNAENVGAIVRNCAAFGVDGIIVGENSSSPYLRRAVRNSMGAVFGIPVVDSSNLVESLSIMKNDYNIKIIAAHLGEDNSIHATDLSGNICIVLGNEGEGISKTVLDACDMSVTIPMMRGTDSLNVASASAVFLYETRKQRMNNHETFL
ncbi:MAG: RNA methyltransferase [Bacteroidota bacterium]|nr:RNA methyltransferase [Bacteroidota bacterium]